MHAHNLSAHVSLMQAKSYGTFIKSACVGLHCDYYHLLFFPQFLHWDAAKKINFFPIQESRNKTAFHFQLNFFFHKLFLWEWKSRFSFPFCTLAVLLARTYTGSGLAYTLSLGFCLLLVKMKEKKLLKIQPLPKVLRVQAIRATTHIHAELW